MKNFKKKNNINSIKFVKNSICLLCSGKLTKVINLPKFPLTGFFINKFAKINKDFLINQAYLFCENCQYLTIYKMLDSNFIYSNYPTISNFNEGSKKILKNFYSFFKKHRLTSKDYNVIDIGGNDSTFLKYFKVKNKINLDPNARSDDKKTKIYKAFFHQVNFSEFKSKKINFYFSSHTLEHLKKPQDLIRDISKNMEDKDYLYLQFPSLERLLINKRFDQLNHEHLNFFSIKSINKLLKLNNLYIHSYEYDDSHFGTLRLLANKKYKNIKIKSLNFTNKNIKIIFRSFCMKCKMLNNNRLKNLKKVQGYGAGLLTPILAYFLPNIQKLKYIFDDNLSKSNCKFITMSPIIKNVKNIDPNKDSIITTSSSTIAVFKIKNKLINSGIKILFIPMTTSF